MSLKNWRLGLDLGTNSIGWSVFSLDTENSPNELVDMGVRIFSDGRNPKSNEPLAVERRAARGQRKQIYRRKLRRKATFRLLQEQGLFPKTKEEAKAIKNLNPYELRIEALDRQLELFELGRVLFNLSVRRGFKSNRKDGSKSETTDKESKSEKISQAQKQTNLDKAITESGCRTLGEYLWKNQEKNKGIRFVSGRMDFYPTRKMYEDEFDKIRSVQEEFFKVAWDKISDAIFSQRALKPQKHGSCLYEPEKERTYKAMPCSQRLRILQDVRNLKYYDSEKQARPITEDQDKILIDLLNSKDKVTFDQMRKALNLLPECNFNLEENRTELKGNSTAVKMRNKNRFGSLWDELSLKEQDEIVELLFTAEEDSEVLTFLQKYNLSDEQKKSIVNLVLESGTSMLCKDVSEKIVEVMEKDSVYTYTTAVEHLGFKYADQSIEKYEELPYYGKVLVGSTMGADSKTGEDNPEKRYGKISNPTVHVALNQTRVVVNALIKEYGKPAQISVELSRDLKASREDKARISKIQKENRKQNEILNKKITDVCRSISYPNRDDRLKYRLWEELNQGSLGHRCIYCGKVIGGSELFSKNIEIEHILPFSRTLLNSETNLTVAHTSCNAFKKERSPYEAFSSNPNGFNWQEILARANMLQNTSKKNKFSPTAMEQFEKDSSFIARQLTDNAYLSKMALKYLKCICDNVWSVNGGMTKFLRDKWEVDSILKRKITVKEIAYFGLKDDKIGEYKKNRADHRHHAVDAVVIALCDRSLVKEISTLNARKMKNRIEVPPMPISRFELEDKVKNIVVSFKPDHGAEGKLSKETILGKIKQEEKIAISALKEDDIPCIKNSRVKKEIEDKFNETKDIKIVRKAFKDIYPKIVVFRELFVSRCPISSLKTENDFNTIIDPVIRKNLENFVKDNSDLKTEEAVQKFSEENKIFKVRCKNHDQNPIEISGKEIRYSGTLDYYAAIVWQIPPKKENGKPSYKLQCIRRTEIGNDKKVKKEVIESFKKTIHPASKILGTIYKNDYLEFSENGIFYKCRVASFAATNNKLDIRPIYATSYCADWIITTNERMLEKYWKPTPGQNWISVNVLFGEKQAQFITVNPIGKVFRKKR